MSVYADILDRAAEVLDEDGWCRFDMTDKHGRHCAIGAITKAAEAVGGYNRENPAWVRCDVLEETLAHELGMQVVTWNDTQVKRKREVQSLFRRVARKIRKEGL